MISYLYLILAFSLNAAGNIFIKLGSIHGLDLSSKMPITLIANNWQLVLGCFVFAANILFYFLALRALPLSVAYPVMVGMTFLIVTTVSLILFREQITSLQYIGFAAIILGLVLATAKFQ
jgi:multidrug transporter EmrE-like cation transporter